MTTFCWLYSREKSPQFSQLQMKPVHLLSKNIIRQHLKHDVTVHVTDVTALHPGWGLGCTLIWGSDVKSKSTCLLWEFNSLYCDTNVPAFLWLSLDVALSSWSIGRVVLPQGLFYNMIFFLFKSQKEYFSKDLTSSNSFSLFTYSPRKIART